MILKKNIFVDYDFTELFLYGLLLFIFSFLEVLLLKIDQESMMFKWQNGVLSNFEYISYLNR